MGMSLIVHYTIGKKRAVVNVLMAAIHPPAQTQKWNGKEHQDQGRTGLSDPGSHSQRSTGGRETKPKDGKSEEHGLSVHRFRGLVFVSPELHIM